MPPTSGLPDRSVRDSCGRVAAVPARHAPAGPLPQAEVAEDGRPPGVPAGAAEEAAGAPGEDAAGSAEAAEVGAAPSGARGKAGWE